MWKRKGGGNGRGVVNEEKNTTGEGGKERD